MGLFSALFLQLLAQHGDDFKRIAASMPNKVIPNRLLYRYGSRLIHHMYWTDNDSGQCLLQDESQGYGP